MAELNASPLPEWELWACAHATIAQHGDRAARLATKRAEELEREGAPEGAATWRLILHRIEQLQGGPHDQPS